MVILDIQKRIKKILDNFKECDDDYSVIDITKFATLFGFDVSESYDLTDNINGKITSTNNSKKIVLNINFSKAHKRYTIAYLISSFLIFYNNETFLGSHTLDDEIDEVAAFARMLLIPENKLTFVRKLSLHQNKLKKYTASDCENLAYLFNVPIEVMDIRLKEVYKKNSVLQRKKD